MENCLVLFLLFPFTFASVEALVEFGGFGFVLFSFLFFFSFFISDFFRKNFSRVSSVYACSYPSEVGTNWFNYYLRVIWGDVKPEANYKGAG